MGVGEHPGSAIRVGGRNGWFTCHKLRHGRALAHQLPDAQQMVPVGLHVPRAACPAAHGPAFTIMTAYAGVPVDDPCVSPAPLPINTRASSSASTPSTTTTSGARFCWDVDAGDVDTVQGTQYGLQEL